MLLVCVSRVAISGKQVQGAVERAKNSNVYPILSTSAATTEDETFSLQGALSVKAKVCQYHSEFTLKWTSNVF